MRLKPDGFIIIMALVILCARLFPSLSEILPFDQISFIGIVVIFFFYGLKLSPDKLRRELSNTRLHILIQATTFLIFPLIVLGGAALAGISFKEPVWLGLLFLSALPSTVSTSVVMVSMAKGNVSAAIFNASISGLIGIIVTPLWMSLAIKTSGYGGHLSDIYLKLLVEVILPVRSGMFMQRYLGEWAITNTKRIAVFDRGIILLIIFKSFAHAFRERIFETVSATILILVAAVVIGLFFLIYYLTGFLSQQLSFSRADTITARYCGTKKSLVHGTVFSGILFGHGAATGLLLLPLMIFHAFQILYISAAAAREGRKIVQ